MNAMHRLLPWLLAAAALAMIVAKAPPPRVHHGYDWDAFGRIPVSAEGRTKPIDTFARSTLLVLSGKQSLATPEGSIPAVQWYMEALGRPQEAMKREAVRIDHPDLLALLGLPRDTRTRFALVEILPKMNDLLKQVRLAAQVPPKQRDPFQRAVMDLYQKLSLYDKMVSLEAPYAVAPLAEGQEWRPLSEAIHGGELAGHASPETFDTLVKAYAEGKTSEFNLAVRGYLETLESKLPGAARRAKYEVVFNRLELFYQASVIYVAAFLLAALGFLTGVLSSSPWSRTLARCALFLVAAAFLVHTLGIASRIYLQGRPPVTNLYSSAVFIGWAVVPVAYLVERFLRVPLGSVVASIIGFATLVVAHNLSLTGDTMEVMQAVLDTNFWLATHVVAVTIGYSATFLAGFLAIVYIVLGVPTRLLRGEPFARLPKAIYGVVCFAAVMSFLGTVLGGIWADQSWGRFWGWDPKENGAALIVFMNLIILHARWGGMIRERGIAMLAVAGNIVTSWSWFGTNMLGVGLHSYGFMDSAMFWLGIFILSQLLIITLALVPHRRWRSAAPRETPPAPIVVAAAHA